MHVLLARTHKLFLYWFIGSLGMLTESNRVTCSVCPGSDLLFVFCSFGRKTKKGNVAQCDACDMKACLLYAARFGMAAYLSALQQTLEIFCALSPGPIKEKNLPNNLVLFVEKR
ncbi:unnamed protein product, partial [Ectocarpus sp. 12 AP-2014]